MRSSLPVLFLGATVLAQRSRTFNADTWWNIETREMNLNSSPSP